MLNSLLVDALAAILRESLANNKERPHTGEARPNVMNDVPIAQAPVQQELAKDLEAEQANLPDSENAEYRRTLRDRARELIKKGSTLTKIANIFNYEKLPTVSGTGKWYSSSVSHLVSSYEG